MQEIPPNIPQPIVDDDSSSDKTNSSHDSIVSSEPQLKKIKVDDNLEEEEEKAADNEEQEEEDEEEDGESDDDEEDEDEEPKLKPKRKLSQLTDEELLDCFQIWPGIPFDKEKTIKEKLPKLRRYLKEVEDSNGFDVDNFPGFHVPLSGLTRIIPHHILTDFKKPDAYYNDLAEWAIEDYNEKNGTSYGDVQFVKTNVTISNYFTYYLTFTATDVGMDAAGSDDNIDARKTFQALMLVNMIKDDQDPEVEFCRLKPNLCN